MNNVSPLLDVKNLSFSYNPSIQDQEVLKNVTFKVHPGEILGILGPNGGGKTTLLKLITGQLKADSGEITFYDKDELISRPPMSYIPQKEAINLSYPLTVNELLMCARQPFEKVSEVEVAEALKKVSFNKDPHQKVNSLSGGEFQRVLLAKADLNRSKIILMDEPTKGLDGVGQDKLLTLIQEFKREKQAAILLVEHNIAQVLRHGDRLLCLNRTFHWHDHKDHLEKNILENTYHCEFEHLLIHEKVGDILAHDHHQCEVHDHLPHEGSHQDNEKGKDKDKDKAEHESEEKP